MNKDTYIHFLALLVSRFFINTTTFCHVFLVTFYMCHKNQTQTLMSWGKSVTLHDIKRMSTMTKR